MPYLDFGGVRKGKNKDFFRRIPHSTDNESGFIAAKRREFNNTDVYRSVFTYETDDLENSRMRGPFYLDFDSDDIYTSFNLLKKQVNNATNFLEKEFGIPKDLQELYYSGSKGFHIVVRPEVFGFDYALDYPEKYLKLAKLFKVIYNQTYGDESLIDFKIYDRRRVLRLVNSINSKSGLYKIPLTHQELQSSRLDDIVAIAKNPRNNFTFSAPYFIQRAKDSWDELFREESPKEKTQEIDTRKKERGTRRKGNKTILPCIKNILVTGIDEGSRNNTTVALASALFQAGYDRDEVLVFLTEWNEDNNPPLSDAEITTTMMSAQSMVDHDKNYGCNSIKNLGLCVPNKCKIANSRRS